ISELEVRLQRAEELRATDPAKARAIWNAVIQLYQDKSWAADVVRRAREGLAATPPPDATPKPKP
ncbi:MAG: hypothetical protein NUV77_15275, partial [Thermoguttaceae bacterium]|nr:hypothetical protein [Thermoguttaceae bacterium]